MNAPEDNQEKEQAQPTADEGNDVQAQRGVLQRSPYRYSIFRTRKMHT